MYQDPEARNPPASRLASDFWPFGSVIIMMLWQKVFCGDEIWAQLTKNLLTKSGTERFRENILTEEEGKYMRLVYELSWLWEMMGIAMAAAVVCVACAALICKVAKKKLSRKVIAVVAAAAFAGAVLAVILIARTPMPL